MAQRRPQVTCVYGKKSSLSLPVSLTDAAAYFSASLVKISIKFSIPNLMRGMVS